LASHGGELRRAAKLIEAAWRDTPHPELAEAYAHLRSGDSARERLARVQTLARLRPEHRESALALARAALDAQEFAAARAALAPLLANPTQRVAMLMAELEEAEHGDAGRAREWMSRAVRANGDPRWTADGMVSERWLPVSPVTGRIDAFAWRVPLAELSYGSARMVEKEPERPVEALPPAPEAPAALPAAAPAAPASASEGATPAAPADARPAEAAKPSAPPAARAATPHAAGERRDAIIPLMHAPDDPGPDHEADARLREPEARPYQLR
ncbi:MAG: hypothetical protein IT538_12600, partial [Variibacter sp.]|nr:hypothetical protein [Variibacter sp.]